MARTGSLNSLEQVVRLVATKFARRIHNRWWK
jgi:hypothetical protein